MDYWYGLFNYLSIWKTTNLNWTKYRLTYIIEYTSMTLKQNTTYTRNTFLILFKTKNSVFGILFSINTALHFSAFCSNANTIVISCSRWNGVNAMQSTASISGRCRALSKSLLRTAYAASTKAGRQVGTLATCRKYVVFKTYAPFCFKNVLKPNNIHNFITSHSYSSNHRAVCRPRYVRPAARRHAGRVHSRHHKEPGDVHEHWLRAESRSRPRCTTVRYSVRPQGLQHQAVHVATGQWGDHQSDQDVRGQLSGDPQGVLSNQWCVYILSSKRSKIQIKCSIYFAFHSTQSIFVRVQRNQEVPARVDHQQDHDVQGPVSKVAGQAAGALRCWPGARILWRHTNRPGRQCEVRAEDLLRWQGAGIVVHDQLCGVG